jgi:hypothetical protein
MEPKIDLSISTSKQDPALKQESVFINPGPKPQGTVKNLSNEELTKDNG